MPTFEVHQGNLVALSLGADQVIRRDTAILQKYLRGIGRALSHFLLHTADLVTRVTGGNDEGADALLARRGIGYRENDRDIGILARGNKGLAAVQHVIVAVSPRARLERGGVGTGLRFGQAEATQHLARGQRPQIGLFKVVAAGPE
jgi:hypothetical protein